MFRYIFFLVGYTAGVNVDVKEWGCIDPKSKHQLSKASGRLNCKLAKYTGATAGGGIHWLCQNEPL
jgi:hypothetical protein